MIFRLNEVDSKLVLKLLSGLFIYPTDTIYGIGCDAENAKLVEKIREIKKNDKKPFSIIAPSFEYILKNCEVDEKFLRKYLPGKYTLILKKKNKNFLPHVSDTEFIGIRIPDNSFIKLLQKTGKPIITTSVNFSGKKPADKIENVDKEILDKINFVIDVGKLSGNPSTIVKGDELIER